MQTKLPLISLIIFFTLSCVNAGAQGFGLIPDLVTVVPQHVALKNFQQREFIRFSNGVANIGQGELRLRPQFPIEGNSGAQLAIQEILDAGRNIVDEVVVSEFDFHAEHNHWHIDDVALYDIRIGSPDGPVLGINSIKTTFCLIDWYKLVGNSNTGDRQYWDCNGEYQGISSGWCDQYHHSLPGQSLEITGAPAGLYYLVSTANPDHSFVETNYLNNTAWVAFTLERNNSGNPKIEIVGNSPCSSPELCGIGVPNR